jgi:hypothetical protein
MDKRIVVCVICGKPLAIEIARTNEQGQPVHEECYVRSINPKRFSPSPED